MGAFILFLCPESLKQTPSWRCLSFLWNQQLQKKTSLLFTTVSFENDFLELGFDTAPGYSLYHPRSKCIQVFLFVCVFENKKNPILAFTSNAHQQHSENICLNYVLNLGPSLTRLNGTFPVYCALCVFHSHQRFVHNLDELKRVRKVNMIGTTLNLVWGWGVSWLLTRGAVLSQGD